jgi:hypothetical protein
LAAAHETLRAAAIVCGHTEGVRLFRDRLASAAACPGFPHPALRGELGGATGAGERAAIAGPLATVSLGRPWVPSP